MGTIKHAVVAGSTVNLWRVDAIAENVHPPSWLCTCACGNRKTLTRRELRMVQSCGCLVRKYVPPELGAAIGRWTVISRQQRDIDGNSVFLCKCACGTERTVRESHLRKGSAGCGAGCPARARKNTPKDPLRAVWKSMLFRCYNSKASNYSRYGGRGITVCDRWRNSYGAFREDMGSRPDNATIERIDNNGPYAPENCRWASHHEQAMNRRSNLRALTLNGVTRTVREWSTHSGIKHPTLVARIRKGLTDAEVLTRPVIKSH